MEIEMRCETRRYNEGITEYEYYGKVDTLAPMAESRAWPSLLKPRAYHGANVELTDEFITWLETNYGPDGGNWALKKSNTNTMILIQYL